MDDSPAISRPGGRHEPRGFTPADLLMLILGCALAFALPQLHHLDDFVVYIGAQRIPLSGWSLHFAIAREAAMKCALAVVPAIMARRVRYGGLPHPAEWLAILAALPWIHEAVDGSVLGLAAIDSRERTPLFAGLAASFAPWEGRPARGVLSAIVCAGLLTALRLGRGRLPGWARTALLSAAALTATEAWLLYVGPLIEFRTWHALSRTLRPSPAIGAFVAGVLHASSDGLLLAVPFAAFLSALRADARTQWAWTAWAGAAAALFALVADVGYDASPSPFEPRPLGWSRLALLAWPLVVAGLTSSIIVARAGRTTREPSRSPGRVNS